MTESRARSPKESGLFRSSPQRLLRTMELVTKPIVPEIHIVGKDRLTELQTRRVIISPTHISDIDVPLTIRALGRDIDMVVMDSSVHTNGMDSLRSLDPTLLWYKNSWQR